MSYVNRFLKRSGVNTPYQDNRTEAQIDEANKANPLSGFGFMSAQQKQQRELQMKLFEAQQQREQEMMQQQLIARMSSQEKIGHYAGAGLMGLMSYLKNRGAAPEIQPAAPQDDPEVTRYNELVREVGPETAMQILAQETGNAGMAQEAMKLRQEKEKAQLETKYKTSQIAEAEAKLTDPNRNYEHKPGYTEEVDVMMDGKPAVQKRTLLKNNDSGGIWKYEKPALKGSVTDPKAWETSKGGINERTKSMEGAIVSTANAFDSYDKLEKLIADTPANGWAGALTAKAEDIVSGLKNFGVHVAGLEGRKIEASSDIESYNWDKLEKFAGANAKIKALVLELAYARAAATGDSSRSLSDKDVQNQLDQIGGSISNPKIMADMIKQNKELMVSKLENLGKYTRIDGQPIYDAYRGDIETLKKRTGVVGIGDEINKRYGSEENALKRLRELEAKYGNK